MTNLVCPFPKVTENFYDGIDEWVEMPEASYHHFYNALDPIDFGENKYLANGREMDLNDGQGVFLACEKRGDKYYGKLMTIAQYRSGDRIKPDRSLIFRPPVC